MHDSRTHDHRALLFLGDLVLVGLAFLSAGFLRFGWSFIEIWNSDSRYPDVQVLIPLMAVGVSSTFWAAGVYRAESYLSLGRELGDLIRAVVLAALIVLSTLYVLKLQEFSRLTLILFFVILLVLAGGARFILRRTWGLRRQTDPLRVLFVGTDGAGRLVAEAAHHGLQNVKFVGYLGRDVSEGLELPRLGDLMDLPAVLASQIVDEVLVCLPVEEWGRLDAIGAVCAEQGKVMRVPVDVVRQTLRAGRVEELGSIPLLTLRTTADARAGLLAKRATDLVGSVVLLVILAPFLAAIAALLLMTQGRPVLFSQLRGGLNGRPFRFHKFRTMDVDAEAVKASLAAQNERHGPAFKMAVDPRVTRIGRWLRRTSLDEVPQLWNVLLGEMSLVGPRPPTLDEVALYDPWHRRRLSVRPGITGLWQVTSRDNPDFDRWVDLDLLYIDSWTFWADVKILTRTPLALLRTPGS